MIVTADHECGGLAIAGSEDQPYPTSRAADSSIHFCLAKTVLSRSPAPTKALSSAGQQLATPPHPYPSLLRDQGAERLSGAIENTDLFHALVAAMDLAAVEVGGS